MTDKITVYSTAWCPDCKRAKKFLGEHQIEYDEIDIDRHPEAVDIVKQLNHGMRSVPTIVFPDGSILVEPSASQLAEKFGIPFGSN
jgi:glutaredoxin-like protein